MNDIQHVGIKQPANRVGLKDQIKQAQSPQEIQQLLSKIRSYARAHPSTVRKCERAAVIRLLALTAKDMPAPEKKKAWGGRVLS